jgi:hypothetical protein
MLLKSTLVAVAAAARFGLATLSSTAASAAPGFHGPRVAAARVAGPRFVGRVNLRVPNRPGITVNPRLPHWHVWHRHLRFWNGRPLVYGAVTPVAATIAAPVAGRCNCLTKEYTPEGAVLFKDLCTNEAAINPPAVAPTAQVQPQPQQ